ncbi:hypothetical protein ABPG72_003758 [Tetrahymena utriculariae]
MDQTNTDSLPSKQRSCIHHLTQRPNWYCIDPNCTEKVKFGCGDCFLDTPHGGHQVKKLIEYENVVKKRCPERQSKYKELQQISEIRNSTENLFAEIRNEIKTQIDDVESSIQKQIRLIEHNFSSRTLNEFNQKVKLLSNRLLFCKFLFCEDELSELSLQLFNQSQYMETTIEKEKSKRQMICTQFKDHLGNIKHYFNQVFQQIQNFSTTFQANMPNFFNLENFTQKVQKINENQAAHNGAIRKVLTLTNNRLMSFSDDTNMHIFDQTFAIQKTIKHSSKIIQADNLGEDLVVISSSDYKIYVYDVQKGTIVKQYSGHNEPILALKSISEDRFVSGGMDKSICIWSLSQDESLTTQLDPHQGSIYSIEKIGLNKFVTCGGDDGKIKIWEDLKVVQALNGHTNKVQLLKYLKGLNGLVSVDEQGIIMLWNLQDLTLIHQFRDEFSNVVDMVELSDDMFCVLGVEQNIKIFKFEFEAKLNDTEQSGSNEMLDKVTNIKGEAIKNISAIMNFSTYFNMQTIAKLDDDGIIGGCQDGHLVLIK